MNDLDIRRTLERLPLDDPPYAVPVDVIVMAGRRARRRTRSLVIAGAAVLGVFVLAAATLLVSGSSVNPRPTDSAGIVASPGPTAKESAKESANPGPIRTSRGLLGTTYYYPAPNTGVFGAIIDAVRASSPVDFRFDFQADNLDGEWRVDGNADDGHGPGRLFITVSRTGADVQRHPCDDPEFASGATCVAETLPDGAQLVRRGPTSHDGYHPIIVLLARSDDVTVTAEAGNYAMPVPSPTVLRSKPAPLAITRSAAPYSLDELVGLVNAVDNQVRDCFRRGCG